MTTIPNELIINLNTSIPGYQKIKYKPKMSIKNLNGDDKQILFNPLIKLNKNIVDKVPEDLRKKQFFNPGLFQSLINYTNVPSANNLNEATNNGNVDNNIKITLETIFSVNSIIYIAGNPYVIVDLQWTSGNWKIDTKKKKEEIDSSKITDPLLYQVIIKDEIISGEKQLELINPSIIYGPNYNGPKNDTASGIDKPSTTAQTQSTTPPINQPISPPINQPISPAISQPIAATNQQLTIQNPTIHPTYNKPSPMLLPPQSKNTLYLRNGPSKEPEILEEDKPTINHPREPLYDVIEPVNPLKTSEKTTNYVKQVFNNLKFYNLINSIFKVSDQNIKKLIINNLKTTTNINIKDTDVINLSKAAYKESVDGIRIVQNSGGGDCFFIAIADAINYYNYHNQENRIISGRYGVAANLYTQKYLRLLVYNFIENKINIDEQLENIAPINAENLNNIFSKSLNGLKEALINSGQSDYISNENYIELARSTYKTNDNFLVDVVDSVPIEIENYDKPFKVLERRKLQKYILSENYWANDIAINALCSELKLNIIPISIKNDKKNNPNISIPFANFENIYNKWKRYLFLYYNNSHYELITFNYKTRVINKNITIKQVINKKVIFNRSSSGNDLPHIYILFTIFAAYYMNIRNPEDKAKFTFQPQIMNIIENDIYTKIYNTAEYSSFFYPIFKSYFPNSIIKLPDVEKADTMVAVGGAKYVPYPYYGKPSYYPYMANKIMKKGDDDSQLAYYITVDLELHPGTSISAEEMKNIKCRQKWNSVRKAYADFTGKHYVITPVYQTKTIKNKQENIRSNKNKTRKFLRK
jgi:hypothetical protein